MLRSKQVVSIDINLTVPKLEMMGTAFSSVLEHPRRPLLARSVNQLASILSPGPSHGTLHVWMLYVRGKLAWIA